MTTKRHSEKKLAVYSECFLEHKVYGVQIKKQLGDGSFYFQVVLLHKLWNEMHTTDTIDLKLFNICFGPTISKQVCISFHIPDTQMEKRQSEFIEAIHNSLLPGLKNLR